MTQITQYLDGLELDRLVEIYEAYNDKIYMQLKPIEGKLISHATHWQPAEYKDDYIEVLYVGLYDHNGELQDVEITQEIIDEINQSIQL